jgi:hypothetical protein
MTAKAGPSGRRARCWALTLGAWTAGTIAAFAVYLRLAQTRAVTSDGASIALQAWDMLHGNPLLRGWTVSDVSFYTTEMPEYALIELVRGLRADVVTIGAAVTYTLVVLFAVLVALGRASARSSARETWVRGAVAAGILLALPQLDNGVLAGPDHTGTSVPLLATWLVLDRAGRRWYVPLVVSLMLCVAQVADSLVLVAGVIPLTLVCGARAARLACLRAGRDARYELALACGALAAAEAASLIQRAVTGAGGFRVRPLNFLLAPVHQIFSHNLLVEGQCLLQLFGAYPDAPPTTEIRFFWLLHLAGVALAALGVAAAAWRLCPGHTRGQGSDLVSQLLLAGIAVSLAAFVVTRLAASVEAVHEIAPVLPFAAALAARQLAPGLSRLFARQAAVPPASVPAGAAARAPMLRLATRLLAVVGIGYAAGVGVALTAPTAPPMSAQLTAWLTRHDLGGSGLGGYWQSSVVTLTSGGAAAIRPVQSVGTKVVVPHGEVNVAWFDPRRSTAHFDVLVPGLPGDAAAVRATWGRPARVYHVGQYTIWYWPKNLLSTIRQ